MLSLDNLPILDTTIESILRAARIPGGAIAVVVGQETVFIKGYGYRDLSARLPATADTVHPIASTTKAMNATLLGMLVDEGKLAWDAPVRTYLPRFQLQDPMRGSLITLRDLVAMRTGLPGHEFVWMANDISRDQLVERLRHLPLSSGLRERFHYSDLTPTVAGHIAELVTGRSWEELIQQRLFDPLGMTDTSFKAPPAGDVTLSYHENARRQLSVTRPFATELIGPAGGSIHSTVRDMARWVAVNLRGGEIGGRRLIQQRTLHDLHRPCMVMGADSAAPSEGAAYGMGWFVDTYNGYARVSHTGYLHDVNSCVTLFPELDLGVVSFSNFASSRVASLINQHAADVLSRRKPEQTVEELLARYEAKIAESRRRHESVRRVLGTLPSHSLEDYEGRYRHPGYGHIDIRRVQDTLQFARNDIVLELDHWHYDSWAFAENDLFEIHKQHLFERANRLVFETDADGDIDAFTMSVDFAVPPARFRKEAGSPRAVIDKLLIIKAL